MTVPVPNYAHVAVPVAVHDGDTFTMRLDFGKLTDGIVLDPTVVVRLAGIDCWELSQPQGPAARDFVKDVFAKASQVVAQTIKPGPTTVGDADKYGRVLAQVWVDGALLADLLRANGFEKTAVG